MRRLMTLGLLAVFALGATVCGGEEQPVPETPVVEEQQQQAQAEFSVADAVKLVAQTSEHADAAESAAQMVNGCDAVSERAAEAVRMASAGAQETRAALGAALASLLEEADFSELEGMNALSRDAEAAAYRAEIVEQGLGVCGPLTDAELDELAGEVQGAYAKFWSGASYIQSLARSDLCNHPEVFERAAQSADRFRALVVEFENGAGTRERPAIWSTFYRVDRSKRNFDRRFPTHQTATRRFEERCP